MKHNGKNIDGIEAMHSIYGEPKKRRKRIEKVNKPNHWKKDFDTNSNKKKER